MHRYIAKFQRENALGVKRKTGWKVYPPRTGKPTSTSGGGQEVRRGPEP